jgi:AbrB family looped-hinge helix DNA binding protein
VACIFCICLVQYDYDLPQEGNVTMETIVSRRGQTVVPAAIRAKYNIKDGDQLVWVDDGQTIRVIPVPSDPIAALYGRGKGQGLTKKLLEDRAKYRKKEHGK